MKEINISITDKLPKITSMTGTAVTDNTYRFAFEFDSEWQDGAKTVYIVNNFGKFVPYLMDENSVEITLTDARYVDVGVSQGTLITSRPCRIVVDPSIKRIAREEISPPEPGIYDQIMQKLNELEQSGVSPEQIAAAIEKYLLENPITAEDVNAVPQNQDAENAGKFLGINEAGDVVPVESGADGITPHIGENGNWFIGETDTGIKAQGEKGEKGDPGEKGEPGEKGDTGDPGPEEVYILGDGETVEDAPESAKVVFDPNETGTPGGVSDISLGITGAAVGQTVKITEVNENGVPTAWEPVDVASGGSETWTQLCDAELTEESQQINQSWVSTPMKKIKVLIETPAASANTTYMPTTVYTNNISIFNTGRFYPTALPLTEAANKEYIIEVYNINDTVYMRFTEYSGGIHGVNNETKGVIKLKDIISAESTGNNSYLDVLYEKIIGIQLNSYSTFGVGTKIKIWGVAL